MDLLITLSQALGLAAAAGMVAVAPLAVAATAASLGLLDGVADFVDDPVTIAVLWAAAVVEIAADLLWPGSSAGFRLGRRVVAGALVFELAAGDEIPWVGLAIGALVAAAVALAFRQIRSGAVKAGGGLRGTAAIEDAAGVGASIVSLIPAVGIALAAAGVALLARLRRRSTQKYGGLRVLR
jgi:hypothetical protein